MPRAISPNEDKICGFKLRLTVLLLNVSKTRDKSPTKPIAAKHTWNSILFCKPINKYVLKYSIYLLNPFPIFSIRGLIAINASSCKPLSLLVLNITKRAFIMASAIFSTSSPLIFLITLCNVAHNSPCISKQSSFIDCKLIIWFKRLTGEHLIISIRASYAADLKFDLIPSPLSVVSSRP
ncbi:hypothetical protein AGLY_010652 [Aphis glycines]|uniref:Uncharacterized protein n=1 Tax=Aphis glycines TaxID=307491 RepID=A0A6G0TE68_APHGL|nr:hypothetical protein AGLY_010652 [Aphis glycines]